MRVLAIETSCDETSVAVVEGNGPGPFRVLSNVVYSQLNLHRKFGGVYPELASREHVAKIQPVLEQALTEAAGTQKLQMANDKLQINSENPNSKNLAPSYSRHSGTPPRRWQPPAPVDFRRFIDQKIDLVAVTTGPGLIGSLLVGVNAAKTLAYAFNKPIVGINHHEGHIAAAWLMPSAEIPNDKFQMTNQIPMTNSQFLISNSPPQRDPATAGQSPNPKSQTAKSPVPSFSRHSGTPPRRWQPPTPTLPALALVVSGGHTQLVMVRGTDEYEVIGRTRDDAAGEAFDKVARLLGLGYPGGPAIAAAAEIAEARRMKHEVSKGESHTPFSILHSPYRLPRPMLDSDDFDFSFSGLKTAVARLAHLSRPLTRAKKVAIAHEFQAAVVEVLVTKTLRAVEQYQPQSVILCGGVAANQLLRKKLIGNCQQLTVNCQLFIPPGGMCTDNAAMIGAAALRRALASQVQNWYDIHADESLPLHHNAIRLRRINPRKNG